MSLDSTTELEGAVAPPADNLQAAADDATPETSTDLAAPGEQVHVHAPQPTLNPELLREISVEADAETVSKAFRTVIKKYSRLARIPGFRVGKVPDSVIRNRFAKEVREEVMEGLVAERFREAIETAGVQPISQPQLTNLFLVDGQPLQFKAAFEVLPEIDLTGYETLAVSRPESALSEEEYTAELDRLLDTHATVETIEEERAAVDGDWVEIAFVGKIQELAQTVGQEGAAGDAPLEPITGEDVLIEVGGRNTLAAFTDALRGSRVGQEMQFEVHYPAEFGDARLAGQTIAYDVTVKALKRKTYPERDEEFARQLGEYESWDDFETKFRSHTASRKRESLEGAAKDGMLGELVARYHFPIPESFVQQQIDARLDRGLRALANQGMAPDDMRKLDFGRLREAQREQAVQEVKTSLLLDRLSVLEGIEVSDEELERELFLASLQAREPLETLRERMQADGSIERMRGQMLREKTRTMLFEKLAK